MAFLAKKVVFLVSERKMKFHHFGAPTWDNLCDYLWKNPLMTPPGRKPSDTHVCDYCSRAGRQIWVFLFVQTFR